MFWVFFSISSRAAQSESSQAGVSSAQESTNTKGSFSKFVGKGAAKGAGIGAGIGAGVYHGTKEGLKQFKEVPTTVIKKRRDAVQDNRKALAGVPVDAAKIAVGTPGAALAQGVESGVKKGRETSKNVRNRLMSNNSSEK